MTRRSAALVAWSVAALYWVLVAAGFALRALNDPAVSIPMSCPGGSATVSTRRLGP